MSNERGPEKIYLQCRDPDGSSYLVDLFEATWWHEQINESDEVYVRSDIAFRLRLEIERLRTELNGRRSTVARIERHYRTEVARFERWKAELLSLADTIRLHDYQHMNAAINDALSEFRNQDESHAERMEGAGK